MRGSGRTTQRVEEAKAYAKGHPEEATVYICRSERVALSLKSQHGTCGVQFIGGPLGYRIAGLRGRAFVDHDAILTARDLTEVQAMNRTQADGPEHAFWLRAWDDAEQLLP